MATYYHYTNSESLVQILQEELLHCTEGSGFSASVEESVFFTKKVSVYL